MEYADNYLCPATDDSNAGGRDVGKERAAPSFGPETVSYGAMHWRSLSPEGSPIPDDYPNRPPTEEPMVSDDTQGTVNHAFAPRHGTNVMFFDSHVEWKTTEELDPETAVGKKGGLLEKLRN